MTQDHLAVTFAALRDCLNAQYALNLHVIEKWMKKSYPGVNPKIHSTEYSASIFADATVSAGGEWKTRLEPNMSDVLSGHETFQRTYLIDEINATVTYHLNQTTKILKELVTQLKAIIPNLPFYPRVICGVDDSGQPWARLVLTDHETPCRTRGYFDLNKEMDQVLGACEALKKLTPSTLKQEWVLRHHENGPYDELHLICDTKEQALTWATWMGAIPS